MTPFRYGFTGATLTAALPWLEAQVGDAPRVVVTMAGSGKDIAALARPGRTIQSWDPQPLSEAIVCGVFAQPQTEELLLPLPITTRADGYARATGGIPGMPPDAAALADGIALDGTDFDRACLGKALIRCSFLGRLHAWAHAATVDTCHRAYLRAHTALRAWRGRPGTLVHTRGSVFADPALSIALADATVVVDTPKVLTRKPHGGDLYARDFVMLNSILAQEPVTLPPWTEATFRRDMPLVWRGPWAKLILFHTSGCYPTPTQVLTAMQADGLPPPAATWEATHAGRTDMAWVFTRPGLKFT